MLGIQAVTIVNSPFIITSTRAEQMTCHIARKSLKTNTVIRKIVFCFYCL